MTLRSHPEYERLLRAFESGRVIERRFSATVYRSSSPAYANARDLVSGEGVRRHGGRWNPPGIAAVYASLTPETAIEEALAQFRRAGIPVAAAMPRVLVALEILLDKVFDLTPGQSRRRLRASRGRTREERWWERQDQGCEALTQAIGRAAREAGGEGLLAPSAADRRGTTVVVFPDRLRAGSRLGVLAGSARPT